MKQDRKTLHGIILSYMWNPKGKKCQTSQRQYKNGGGCLGMGRGYKNGTNFQL